MKEIRTCPTCRGDGWHSTGVIEGGAYILRRTNKPCQTCEGLGYVEITTKPAICPCPIISKEK